MASLIRTEIGKGNWLAGERIPHPEWLAQVIGIRVEAAEMAVSHLVRDGWVSPDPTGRHVVCPLDRQRRATRTLYAAIVGKVPSQATEPLIDHPRPASAIPLPRHPSSANQAPPFKSRQKVPRTYLIGIDGLPQVKIGYTGSDPKRRLTELQIGHPLKLSLLWYCEGDYERALHVHFHMQRVRGEWFDLSAFGDPIEVVKAAVEEIKAASQE